MRGRPAQPRRLCSRYRLGHDSKHATMLGSLLDHAMSRIARRRFIRNAAATAAGGSLGLADGPLTASPRQKQISLGFSLYGMRSLGTHEALRTCAEIGYKAAELVLNPGWPCEPKSLAAADRREIRESLVDLNLELPALMEHVSLLADEVEHRGNLERLKAASELAQALSPDHPPVIETTLGGNPAQWEQVRHEMAERLHSWAKAAEASRTIIAIKPHVGGALHTPEGARWLLDQVRSPSIKLVYDYSHYELRGYDLEQTARALLADSVFIHVKDSAGEPGDVKFLLPGEGRVNYVEYFSLIRRLGYSGAVVVEVSGQIHGREGYDAVAAAKRCYANLAPALEET